MTGFEGRMSRQRGAVSLFVVMFTSMLLAAVTVGFTILMLSDQQQSTDNDLAQSALDSAYAGSEDAKRILVQYTACRERGDLGAPGSDCGKIYQAISDNKCDTVSKLSGGEPDGERLVKSDEGDSALQQAYTCVKISPDTDSYVGRTRTEGDIRVVPIKTDGAPVATVKIEWLTVDDVAGAADESSLELTPVRRGGVDASQRSTIELPTQSEWEAALQGSILRVGSIQYKPGAVDLTEIDEQARAVFLHPEEVVAGVTVSAIDLEREDSHRPLTVDGGAGPALAEPNAPQPGVCRRDATKDYLCEAVLSLPFAGGADELARYLTIASAYRDTSFRVTMYDGDPTSSPANAVLFRNVQPEIDVTGRANDVFRRIVSRVESADASEAPYPRAALGTTGDVCKNYLITDDPHEYSYLGSGCSMEPRIVNPDAAGS